MRRLLCLALPLALLTSASIGQVADSIWTEMKRPSVDLGLNVANPAIGPYLLGSIHYLGVGITYGIGRSNGRTDSPQEFSWSLNAKLFYTFGALSSDLGTSGLYVGYGYTHLKERSSILGYTGDGSISANIFFFGFRGLDDKRPFYNLVRPHVEIGYASWNYSNAILTKAQSLNGYRYSRAYFAIGFVFHIL